MNQLSCEFDHLTNSSSICCSHQTNEENLIEVFICEASLIEVRSAYLSIEVKK